MSRCSTATCCRCTRAGRWTVFFHEPGTALPPTRRTVKQRHFERLDRYGSGFDWVLAPLPEGPLAYLPTPPRRRGARAIHAACRGRRSRAAARDAWDEVESRWCTATTPPSRATTSWSRPTSAAAACCASATAPTASCCRAARSCMPQYQIGGGAAGNIGADQLVFSRPLTGALGGAVVRGLESVRRDRRPRSRTGREGTPQRARGLSRAPAARGDAGRLRAARRGGGRRLARGRALRLDRQLAHGARDDRSRWAPLDARGTRCARDDRRAPRSGAPDRRGHRAAAAALRAARDPRHRLRRRRRTGARTCASCSSRSSPTAGPRTAVAASSTPTNGPSARRCTAAQIEGRLHAVAGIEHVVSITMKRFNAPAPGVPNTEAARDGLRRSRAAGQRPRPPRARADPLRRAGRDG